MRKLLKKIEKNYKLRNAFKKNEQTHIINNVFFRDFNTLKETHLYFAGLNYSQTMCYSKSHLRCFLTGRARATIKKFMLSRMILKKIGLNGYITGFKKAS
jgi:ribosomal protein S14